ncbi:MAG: hypothetical protein AB1757_04035 [Acidobacteriota bacterium]
MFERSYLIKPFFMLFVAMLPMLITGCALSAYAGQSAYARQSGSMVPVSSNLGGFSVMMPANPQYTTRPIKTVSGHWVTQHVYSVESPDGRYAYFVAYNDYPYALDGEALNRACQGQADGMRGRIMRQENVSISGYSGRVVRIEGNDFIGVSQVVIVGRRLYQVMFVMPKNANVPSEASRFLNSFEIRA